MITFGKHNGKTVDEVPYGYLVWMLVGQNTGDRWQHGNYGWLKEHDPAVFEAMKARLASEIAAL